MTDNVVNKQFYELFKQKDRFIRFAYYYVLDHEASEDLVMDSFMYYWENREKIDVNGNLKAYIFILLLLFQFYSFFCSIFFCYS